MEIGIRQADGSFVPVMTQGAAAKKRITLSPAKEGQKSAHILLYTGENGQIGQFISTLDVQEMDQDIELVLQVDESGKLAATATSGNNSYYTDIEADFIPGSIPEPETDSNITVDESSFDIPEESSFQDDTDSLENMSLDEELPESGTLDDLNLDDIDFPTELVEEDSDDIPTVDSILAENGTSLEESVENADDMFGLPDESLAEPLEENEEPTTTTMDDDFGLPDMDSGMEINLEEDDSPLATLDEESSDSMDDYSMDDYSMDLPEEDSSDFNDADDFSMDLPESELDEPEESSELPDFDLNPDDDLASLESESNIFDESSDDNIFTDSTESSTDYSMDLDASDDSSVFADESDESIFEEDDDYTSSTAFATQSGYESDSHIEVEEPYHVAPPKQEKSNIFLFLLGGIAIGAIITALLLFFVFNNNSSESAEILDDPDPIEQPSAVTLDQPMPADATSVPETTTEKPLPVDTNTTAPMQVNDKVNVYYTVSWGDTLWDLAWSFYQDPNLYKAIVNMNAIQNPDVIRSGSRLIIPDVEYTRD